MKKSSIVSLMGVSLVVLAATVQAANSSGSGPGQTRFGVDVSAWSSSVPVLGNNALLPIGGAGQINGNFVTAERNGIQIGIRASERFVGLLPPVIEDAKVGFYSALTGISDTFGRATWNYDIHVDLRGAQGVAKNTTLADYDLVVETDIFGGPPVSLDFKAFAGVFNGGNPSIVLFQTSQNPKFGNPPFNSFAPRAYSFRLVLTPKTFNGPPLVAEMSVVVSPP
jgi:hypothetical protein